MEPTRRSNLAAIASLALIHALLCVSCSPKPQSSPDDSQGAKAVFDSITKEAHVPAASANGVERLRLQNDAAKRYADFVKRYPGESNLCAQSLRNLGNIAAAQTNIDVAVTHYRAVGDRYSTQEWEVLQAWKSAGDLLWETGRTNDSRVYYGKIIARFDATNLPAIYQLVVRGSKSRL